MTVLVCNMMTDPKGRELLQHGTAQFPVACYQDDLAREILPWHWHEELEAAVITEGTAVVSAGTEKYVIKAGGGFFINSGVLHAAQSADTSVCRFHSLVFHPRLVGGGADSIFWQKYIQPLMNDVSLKGLSFQPSVPWEKEVLEAVESAWQSCHGEVPGYEFAVREFLSKVLFLLSGQKSPAQKKPSDKMLRDADRVKQMLWFIQEHFGEEITIAQIAESASVSESECLRCFRKNIGTTPIQYVKQYRIQKAAELLLATEQKIVDIGIQCGFQEMSYFARSFREQRGCTPSQYRQQVREGGQEKGEQNAV